MNSHSDFLAGFQVVRPLKPGGQKAAYVASHPQYGLVVVKVGQCSSPRSLERIRREVQLLKDIDSAYYPKHYDFKESPDGQFVIVEEFIESQTLSACMNEFVDPKAAFTLMIQLVDGLSLLWDKKVVHRDIKPDNILIVADKSPRIIDLGIARLLDAESLTLTKQMRGPCSPYYASPEQLRNRKDRIDFRSDQFSIGIVLGQLLLKGTNPFDPLVVGNQQSIDENIVQGSWAENALEMVIPGAAHATLAKMLGVEPFMRYRTHQDFKSALTACQEYLA